MQPSIFRKKIWNFYKKNKRHFPWRETTDPYKILVSEVMLQQTQTSRVLPKYSEFLKRFPSISTLAKSKNEDILRVWSGLGYNRRALYLKNTARLLSYHTGSDNEATHREEKKWLTPEFMQTLPGIGPNTAGAIYVFSTNNPHVFIETNIRRVFIHEFFKDKEKIPDKSILALIERTLDKKNPRDWYYALMDYGAYLGKLQANPNWKSAHYTKQSRFDGSLRQTRGRILKILLEKKGIQITDLESEFEPDGYYSEALEQLTKEGFITISKNKIVIT